MTFRFGCGLAVFALSATLFCTAHAGSGQQGRPIEFSQPKSLEVITNLQQLATKKDALKQLEEDLNRPLQAFTPKSSLEGVIAPPRRSLPPSPIQSKRAQELLERRKDWVFLTPEDLLNAPTVEQILKLPEYVPDGQEKKDLPAVERYYQSLISKRDAKSRNAQPNAEDWLNLSKEATKADASPPRNNADLPEELKASAEALRSAFDTGLSDSPSAPGATLSGLSDPFRLPGKASSEDQLADHKKLMDEYRLIVDPTWRPFAPTRPVPPAFGLANAAPNALNPAPALPSVPEPTLRKGADLLSDPLHPVLGPEPLPNVNAAALGQRQPTLSASESQPRRAIPQAPDFTAPRRKF